MICFTWSRGRFCLKTHFAKLDENAENARSVSEIVRKVYIIGKIPFHGLQMVLLQTFGWKNELSKSFSSRDRILPKYGHGRGHFRIFRRYLKFVTVSHLNIFLMMSSNYSK